MRTSGTAAALAVVAIAASAALAGSKPHLARIEPPRAMAGGVVEVVGTNFTDDLKEISATLGGEPAFVLEARSDWLKVLLPSGVKAGVHGFEVTIAGERSNRVDLTIRPESERPEKAREDMEKFEGAGARQGSVDIITLLPPEPVHDRGSVAIRVSGEADLPDGCKLLIALRLEDDAITSLTLPIQSKRFAGSLGPYTRELFADDYWIEAVFLLADQAPSVRKNVRELYARDPLGLAARERAADRQPVRLGAPGQKEKELIELRAHVASCLSRVRELLRELETQFSGAARSYSAFRRDGKVDEAAWEAWLAKKSLRSVPPGDRAARADEIRSSARFLAEDGAFADARWREWLDHKFRADVADLAKGHAAYCDRFLVVKHSSAMASLMELFAMLRTLSENRSEELYRENGLPIRPQDATAGASGDEILRPRGGKVYPADIEKAARRIARAVSLEESKPADSPQKQEKP